MKKRILIAVALSFLSGNSNADVDQGCYSPVKNTIKKVTPEKKDKVLFSANNVPNELSDTNSLSTTVSLQYNAGDCKKVDDVKHESQRPNYWFEFTKIIFDFISKVISSVAWPVFILVALILFKKEISRMIGKFKMLSIKRKELEIAIHLLDKYDEAEIPANKQEKVSRDPVSNVIASWLSVSSAVESMFELKLRDGYFDSTPRINNKKPSVGRMASMLFNSGLIDKADLNKIRDLNSIRNAIVHGIELSFNEDDAIKYVSLSDQVVSKLNGNINRDE